MISDGMTHSLRTSVEIPARRGDVFSFFSEPANLEQITPPELCFRILTPGPFKMVEGALIDYRLRLFFLPFRWKTLISRWEPPRLFVDEQIEGPYAFWRHTHRFIELDNGTRMDDEVLYRLPLSPFGEVAYPFIALQLKKIFEFRRKTVLTLFS